MQKMAEEQIADVQMGFRKGVGTIDKIFMEWRILACSAVINQNESWSSRETEKCIFYILDEVSL